MRYFTCFSLLVAGLFFASCGSPGPDESTEVPRTAGQDAPDASTKDGDRDSQVTGVQQPESPDNGPTETADDKKPDAVVEKTVEQDAPIQSAEELSQALKEVNPGFGGVVHLQPVSPELAILGIQDKKLRDISPLRRLKLDALELKDCDVTDLTPLKGQPLRMLFLENNRRLTDIEPLRGMPLEQLYLDYTRVRNLAPLRGAPLVQANFVGTRVDDLSPLSESPIEMLWLSFCPVKDISPLKKTPLVSLTVERTEVTDISPLAGHAIQRLHIGGCTVTDLTPLKSMRLTRLIFAPEHVKKGIEFAGNMPTMKEIGTSFDSKLPPGVFWQKYNAGEFK